MPCDRQASRNKRNHHLAHCCAEPLGAPLAKGDIIRAPDITEVTVKTPDGNCDAAFQMLPMLGRKAYSFWPLQSARAAWPRNPLARLARCSPNGRCAASNRSRPGLLPGYKSQKGWRAMAGRYSREQLSHSPVGFIPYGSPAAGERELTAGPLSAVPSIAKWEPWHGQSQHRSKEFQCRWQPTCVQAAETR
jgi:hypothetical protein